MATKAQVKDRALTLLGRKRLGQSAPEAHSTRIGTAFDEVYQDLKDEGLAIWASTAAVPTKLVPHMTALVAINAIDDFGVSDSRYQRITARASVAKREIRRLTTPPYESLEEPVDY